MSAECWKIFWRWPSEVGWIREYKVFQHTGPWVKLGQAHSIKHARRISIRNMKKCMMRCEADIQLLKLDEPLRCNFYLSWCNKNELSSFLLDFFSFLFFPKVHGTCTQSVRTWCSSWAMYFGASHVLHVFMAEQCSSRSHHQWDIQKCQTNAATSLAEVLRLEKDTSRKKRGESCEPGTAEARHPPAPQLLYSHVTDREAEAQRLYSMAEQAARFISHLCCQLPRRSYCLFGDTRMAMWTRGWQACSLELPAIAFRLGRLFYHTLKPQK